MPSIEFRVFDNLPVEVSDDHKEISVRGSKRFITDGGRAFEVWRGKRRDRLLDANLARQKPQPKVDVVIPKVEKTAPVVIEAVEQFVATSHNQIVQTDEEAEQEFLNAVPADNRELYQPKEDEWFLAHVVHRDWKGGKYLLLELSTGDIVYCPWQKVKRSPGNHSLCLPLGTECLVRMKLDRGKYFALELQVDGDQPYGISRARITVWHGMAGTAYRECGCPIFVLATQALPIEVGDWVEINRRGSPSAWFRLLLLKFLARPSPANQDGPDFASELSSFFSLNGGAVG